MGRLKETGLREQPHQALDKFFATYFRSLAPEIHSQVLAKLANEPQIESLATNIASDIF
jgi:hypothetical protein